VTAEIRSRLVAAWRRVDEAMSPGRGRAAIVLTVLATTVVSMWLRARGYTWLLADMIYDDQLFTRSAGHLLEGDWLGPYDMMTLSKGPTYPLFIAGAYQLNVPLKLAEHGLHLMAAGMLAWAVWRIFRLRTAALAAYVVVALNPAYLGSAASRVTREVIYGSLSLILLSGVLVFLTYVPALVRRGLLRAVPVGVAAGLAIGAVLAAYYLCREERSWLAPALLVAGLAGAATWGRIGRGGEAPGYFSALMPFFIRTSTSSSQSALSASGASRWTRRDVPPGGFWSLATLSVSARMRSRVSCHSSGLVCFPRRAMRSLSLSTFTKTEVSSKGVIQRSLRNATEVYGTR